ncbi:MAG TPA: pitrilysin family protein [Thermotogota bacterium]|nr:pitrilysin family protein [Thermotogota bacterium]
MKTIDHPGLSYQELPNGAQVYFQKMPGLRSVCIGVAVRAGSSHEPADLGGIAHFTEHMVFKGTTKRDAFSLKEPIEKVGGTLNAFTGKETTVYFARVPDFQAKVALEILLDIGQNAVFPEEEFSLEKEVVIEEIWSSEDDPVDQVYENLFQLAWNGGAYGRPVLGNFESVSRTERKDLVDFYRSQYHSKNLIVSVAGDVAQDFFNPLEAFPTGNADLSPAVLEYAPKEQVVFEEKEDLQQVHLLLGLRAPGRKDPHFDAFQVLNVILSGGMSSRLFHRVREKLGLVYAIDSGLISYPSNGIFYIYAATSAEKVGRLVEELRGQVSDLLQHGVREEELEYGKARFRGKLLLSTESTYSSMMRNLDSGLSLGRPETVEKMVERILHIDSEKLQEVIREYLSHPWLMSTVVPTRSVDLLKASKILEKGF